MSAATEIGTTADALTGPRFRRRLRRRADEPAAAEAGQSGGDTLPALQAEVVLLREENARLKAAAHREPDLGDLLERARLLPAGGGTAGDRGDEAAHMLLDGMVMRESLLSLCREMGTAMAGLEARLDALGGDAAIGRS